jgi:hypothetical protein
MSMDTPSNQTLVPPEPAEPLKAMELEGEAWQNFVAAIRSPDTKVTYINSMQHFAAYYRRFREVKTPADLISDPAKLIEARVMGFIAEHKTKGLSYGLAYQRKCAIKLFLDMNDITINFKRVNKCLPPKKKAKDRGYYKHEIVKLLRIADLRMRMIILLMSSAVLLRRIAAQFFLLGIASRTLSNVLNHNKKKVSKMYIEEERIQGNRYMTAEQSLPRFLALCGAWKYCCSLAGAIRLNVDAGVADFFFPKLQLLHCNKKI